MMFTMRETKVTSVITRSLAAMAEVEDLSALEAA
jgi:hypothetical protein